MTKVRVVEDTGDIAALLKVMLEQEGFEVEVTSRNFEDLIARGPWQGIDAALIDLNLPEVQGLDILRYLRGEFPNIRRVVLTATAPADRRVIDLADSYLEKPASLERIHEALEGT